MGSFIFIRLPRVCLRMSLSMGMRCTNIFIYYHLFPFYLGLSSAPSVCAVSARAFGAGPAQQRRAHISNKWYMKHSHQIMVMLHAAGTRQSKRTSDSNTFRICSAVARWVWGWACICISFPHDPRKCIYGFHLDICIVASAAVTGGGLVYLLISDSSCTRNDIRRKEEKKIYKFAAPQTNILVLPRACNMLSGKYFDFSAEREECEQRKSALMDKVFRCSRRM